MRINRTNRQTGLLRRWWFFVTHRQTLHHNIYIIVIIIMQIDQSEFHVWIFVWSTVCLCAKNFARPILPESHSDLIAGILCPTFSSFYLAFEIAGHLFICMFCCLFCAFVLLCHPALSSLSNPCTITLDPAEPRTLRYSAPRICEMEKSVAFKSFLNFGFKL